MSENIMKEEGCLPAPLFEFPCDFPIKIVGIRTDDFAQQIIEIIKKYSPEFIEAEVEMKPSTKGNYLSLGVIIPAKSQKMLDDLYQELTRHPLTKFVL